ncbi:hypothetical protein CVU37_10865 [candidate division BRC1 bacterium HGW-BRC1-1]|nr:MAG: hypothetical protein CVU37_10865 [candidate division BRC1 bacterium HGW-BRC1-1]
MNYKPSPVSNLIGNKSALLVILLCVAALTMLRPSIHGNDGVQNYAPLRSLLIDGDLDYANEYAHYFHLNPDWFDNLPVASDPTTRHPTNLYGIGSALLWSPWIVAVHGSVLALNATGLTNISANGYGPPYQWAIGIASCFYASLGLFLLFRFLTRLTSPNAAFWSVLAIWLASPLTFYMYLHPSMSHANSFFLAVLMLVIYAGGDSVRRWAVLGAVAGLLVLTRYQDAALLAVFIPLELKRVLEGASHGFPQRLLRIATAAVACVLVFSPQFAVWNYLHGTPFSGPREYLRQGSFHPFPPLHAWDVLFSSRHGLFYWHPLLLLGFVGLLIPKLQMKWRIFALTGFFTQVWIIGSWSHWWAGASFGHRMFISSLPLLAVGIALLMQTFPRFNRWTPSLVILFMLWNFGLIVQYGAGLIKRDQPVSWAEMARNNFISIPGKIAERLKH